MTSEVSTPLARSASRTAAALSTTTCMPLTEPGSASVRPVPIAIEHAEPGRGELHEADLVADAVVVVGVEADLVDVERLRAVDVGDREVTELELDVHGTILIETEPSVPIARLDRHASGTSRRAARNDAQDPRVRASGLRRRPEAPIAAVAKHAGVGIGALYRRYAEQGGAAARAVRRRPAAYIEAAESALADEHDRGRRSRLHAPRGRRRRQLAHPAPGRHVHADPGPLRGGRPRGRAQRAALRARAAAGEIRADASVNDLGPILEQLASLKIGDADRSRALAIATSI